MGAVLLEVPGVRCRVSRRLREVDHESGRTSSDCQPTGSDRAHLLDRREPSQEQRFSHSSRLQDDQWTMQVDLCGNESFV